MSAKTNKLENLLTDFLWRAQNLTIGGATATWNQAPVFNVGLMNVSKWNATQAVALGVFIVRPDTSGTLHLLKCTTAGTTGSSAPTAPSANDGTVTDGSVVWTDQYTNLEAATIANLGSALPAEFSGGSYARQAITAALANMAGTQSAGSTVASTGTGATTSINAYLSFNGGSGGEAGLFFITDAAGVNIYEYGFMTGGSVSIAPSATVTFNAGQLSIQEDN